MMPRTTLRAGPSISGGPMPGATSRPPAAGAVTAVTVHGPRGVLDLTVPTGATLADVARTYAAEAGLPGPLPFVTRTGRPLPMDAEVGALGLVPGSMLVAIDPAAVPAPVRRRTAPGEAGPRLATGAASATWLSVAVGIAVVAGLCTALLPEDERWPAVAVLLVAALVGCLPFGALAAHRVVAAPVFAAAAVLAVVWDPLPERLPTVLGSAALAGAVTAAVGRALSEPDSPAEQALRTWLVVGSAWFVLAGVAALTSTSPQTVWAVLFLLAVLGARLVPEIAVDVPDQYLLDLERLAVTAWSARERPSGRRGRIVVPQQAVDEVAGRGTRTVRAATVAIFLVVLVSAPLLLWTADLPLDRTGARCLVGFGGAALLLAARSYRHVLARRLLRLSGVVSLALVAGVLLGVLPGGREAGGTFPGLVALLSVGIAVVLVLVAVLAGRGWRSAWWSRRAEIAEAV
ncbi:MAG TPA: hypothetical protein VNS46_15095, partial [Nocardioides sp.]|nr:hypothetical protein [Nocardioides sp.]